MFIRMTKIVVFFLISRCFVLISAQFTIQTYPDPRADPFSCRLILQGHVCDPNEVLSQEDRLSLNDKIQQLQTITMSIKNTAPACQDSPNSNLKVMVALLDKLGFSPLNPTDIEKFTNGLRQKYMGFQDVGMCDTLVLIVNSRMDRQVFTVAGRDARLSREVLQSAFQRNIGHFRSGQYVLGLEGMIKYIASAYNSAHIMQGPAPPPLSVPDTNTVDSVQPVQPVQPIQPIVPSSSFITNGVTNSQAGGVRHKPVPEKQERFSFDGIPEEDKLWVELLIKAVGRCGNDEATISQHLRAVVEEAMAISLKLLSDSRYNKIEEQAQDFNAGVNARDKAWKTASDSFIDDLYAKYGKQFPRKFDQCPETVEEKPPTALL